MSASRAEGSRLAPLNAINQHFLFDFGQFLDFHGFSKTPPLSKIRKIQAMDEITIVNNIFAENRKFTESQAEIKRRKAAVDCFNCCERMRRMPQLLKYASVDTNRGIFYQLRHPKHSFTAIEAVNRDLSTENLLTIFNEFLVFTKNAVSFIDFAYFLECSDF